MRAELSVFIVLSYQDHSSNFDVSISGNWKLAPYCYIKNISSNSVVHAQTGKVCCFYALLLSKEIIWVDVYSGNKAGYEHSWCELI